MSDENKAFNWDDDFEETSSEFVVFPKGDYNFKIVDFERAYFEGSDKIPACNEAKIKYEVIAPDGKTGTVQQNLFLHSKSQWQLTNFACAIGHARRGDGTFKVRWNEIIGATGRFQLAPREYKDKMYNNIVKFYDKNDQAAAPAYTQGAF